MGHIAHLRKHFKSINTYDYIITLIKRGKKTIIYFFRIYWNFIWTNWNPLHPMMLCAKFGWNWLWFWRRFLNFVSVFSPFRNYLPLEKGWAFLLNKLESLSPRDTLCQVWLKLAQLFWRRRFLKVVNLFLLFPNYLPFGKGVALHLNKLESPSPRDTLCQVLLKLAQWFWRRR